MEEVTLTQFLIICPLVFLAGLVDAIAGGGGLISLPGYLIAGIPPHVALGTNKFSSTLGTSIATFRLAKNGFIPLKLGLLAAACAVVGSNLGARLVLTMNPAIVEKVMIYSLPIIAFYVLRNKSLGQQADEEPAPERRQYMLTVVLALSSLAGLGLRISSGVTKAANLASNIGALVVFLLHGKVYFPLAIAGAICNILGNYIGAGLVLHNAAKFVRPVMMVVLVLLFCKLASGM